jgi:aerobic C4-dicarboxylate transport protein
MKRHQAIKDAICASYYCSNAGGRGTLVFDFIEKFSHVLFAIVGFIMKLAPIGAFGAMAFTIAWFRSVS